MPKTFLVVDAADFEAEVTSIFGRPFSFAADRELGDDADQVFHVDGQISAYPRAQINAFATGGEHRDYISQALLDELCRRGRIAPGDYLIRT